jgi:tRNA pseudouridine38-40 synthase
MKNDETEARRITLGRAPRVGRLHTWKLTLEYDGSRYSGWAEQRNARTVMGELRLAAEKSLGRGVELVGAGRTDAGVHALGQVAHVRAELAAAPPDLEQLLLALNEALPYDIAVLAVEPASNYFHARHDALRRTYVYRIAKQKDAFSKKFVWWIKEPLDIAAMRQAVALLPGRHDFVLFRAADAARPDESTIVEVESASLEENERRIEFRIEASHFLWRMVRRVMGAVVRVGRGDLSVEQFRRLINAEPQAGVMLAAWTVPSAGLFLEKATYPESRPSAPAGATPATRAGAGRTTRRGPARRA